MKILLANYRYFVSGGPERYMFNVAGALQRSGHEIIPFSIRYARNLHTPYSSHFVDPLGGAEEVRFSEQSRSLKTLWNTLRRLFYAPEVRRAVERAVDDFRPDVAYVLHYLRKLSPSLLVGLRARRVPIVVRLSDYAMVCPQAHLYRAGRICELCRESASLWPSISHRCLPGGAPSALVNAAATFVHKRMRIFELVDYFVATNSFMRDVMIESGVPPRKCFVIPTFVDLSRFGASAKLWGREAIVYVGRLEEMKGVHVLLEAVAGIREQLKTAGVSVGVAGSGSQAYRLRLEAIVDAHGLRDVVRFHGDLAEEQLTGLLGSASISVLPALWYENLPNSLLESMASGCCVVASRLGTLQSAVKDGVTGRLFLPGDSHDLGRILLELVRDREQACRLGLRARECAEAEYSESRHLGALLDVFGRLSTSRRMS